MQKKVELGKTGNAQSFELKNYPLRMLLLDEDRVFGAVMRRKAQSVGVMLTCCGSLEDLKRYEVSANFDVVLLDLHLGLMHDGQLAYYLNQNFSKVPVAVITSSAQAWLATNLEYPDCVKSVMSKELPYGDIIEGARAMRGQSKRRKMPQEFFDSSLLRLGRPEASTAGTPTLRRLNSRSITGMAQDLTGLLAQLVQRLGHSLAAKTKASELLGPAKR